MVDPPSVASRTKVSIAACHSGAICPVFGRAGDVVAGERGPLAAAGQRGGIIVRSILVAISHKLPDAAASRPTARSPRTNRRCMSAVQVTWSRYARKSASLRFDKNTRDLEVGAGIVEGTADAASTTVAAATPVLQLCAGSCGYKCPRRGQSPHLDRASVNSGLPGH